MTIGWELHLRHYGRDGSLKNGYIAPLSARYTNSLDADDPLQFTLNAATYADLEEIAEFDLIEVMIRNKALGVQSADGGFVRDFVGIVRGSNPDRFTDDGEQTVLTWFAPEQKHLLAWREVLWYAGYDNRSVFDNQPAETVVKTLVNYNCTTLATVANGRWREGDLAANMQISLDVEADGGGGNNVSLPLLGANLLDALLKVCELGGDYYNIAWQGGSLGGSHEFALTWGRGSDKSSGANRVLFSLANNTMRQPRRRYRWATGTTALAAGQGEGANRATTAVNSSAYATTNDIELFVDARNSDTANGRTGQGQAALKKTEEVSELDFTVLQTGDVFYSPVSVTGRSTYHVGDRVLAVYGDEETRRIRSVGVDWSAGAGDLLTVEVEAELWS